MEFLFITANMSSEQAVEETGYSVSYVLTYANNCAQGVICNIIDIVVIGVGGIVAEEQGMITVIPSRKCRKEDRFYDKAIYKLRHLVENAFLKLKGWRGIATRYCKCSSSFLAAVQIRCIFLWLQILF